MSPSDVSGERRGSKPRGRDATVAAIVASARELYRSRTPAEVTMQEIADHANVNRGLLHHYFGSKEDLFTAIFQVTSQAAASEVEDAPDVLSGLARTRRSDGYSQMLAWALVNGMDAADFVSRSPTMAELTRQAGAFRKAPRTPCDEISPFEDRFVVAAAIALSMGWQTFEPFLVRAAALEAVPLDVLRSELGRIIDLMVTSALAVDDVNPPDA